MNILSGHQYLVKYTYLDTDTKPRYAICKRLKRDQVAKIDRTYISIGINPTSRFDYNIFHGWDAEYYPKEHLAEIILYLQKLIPDNIQYEYFCKWLATILQNPGIVTGIIPYFTHRADILMIYVGRIPYRIKYMRIGYIKQIIRCLSTFCRYENIYQP